MSKRKHRNKSTKGQANKPAAENIVKDSPSDIDANANETAQEILDEISAEAESSVEAKISDVAQVSGEAVENKNDDKVTESIEEVTSKEDVSQETNVEALDGDVESEGVVSEETSDGAIDDETTVGYATEEVIEAEEMGPEEATAPEKAEDTKKDATESSEGLEEETNKSKKAIKEAENKKVEKIHKDAAKLAAIKQKVNAESKKAIVNDEKREARRKRRIRNQVISYVVTGLLLLILVGAILFVLSKILKGNDDNGGTNNITVTEPSETTEDIISDLIGNEEVIEEPETPEEVPEEPEVNALLEYVDGIIDSMTIEEKVAGLFIATPESITGVNLATAAGDGTKNALEKYAVGGLIYSARNINTQDQFQTMISNTLTMVKYPTFIAIAEEGGTISPLANAGFYEAVSSAQEIAATGDVTESYSAGVSIGLSMKSIGFNLNFAPVADISDVDGNILGNRTYAETAVSASPYVNSMMKGLEDSEVTACLKYFPGMGMITSDPASGRIVSDRTDEEFSQGEFLVYQSAIENGANMIQMSNCIYSSFEEIPASLSSVMVTEVLRERLGFEGVVVSGNLSDIAITDYYGADEAAIGALKAGCDMLYCPENFETAYNGILKAIEDGVISENRIDDALERILSVKYAANFE